MGLWAKIVAFSSLLAVSAFSFKGFANEMSCYDLLVPAAIVKDAELLALMTPETRAEVQILIRFLENPTADLYIFKSEFKDLFQTMSDGLRYLEANYEPLKSTAKKIVKLKGWIRQFEESSQIRYTQLTVLVGLYRNIAGQLENGNLHSIDFDEKWKWATDISDEELRKDIFIRVRPPRFPLRIPFGRDHDFEAMNDLLAVGILPVDLKSKPTPADDEMMSISRFTEHDDDQHNAFIESTFDSYITSIYGSSRVQHRQELIILRREFKKYIRANLTNPAEIIAAENIFFVDIHEKVGYQTATTIGTFEHFFTLLDNHARVVSVRVLDANDYGLAYPSGTDFAKVIPNAKAVVRKFLLDFSQRYPRFR